MQYNQHLKDIGLKKSNVPSYWFEGEERQKPDKNGFREVEFYNLYYLFDCFIYSYLMEGRETFIRFTPNPLEYDKWVEIYDKILKAFRLRLTVENPTKNQKKQINYGMRLFIKYYDCLWS